MHCIGSLLLPTFAWDLNTWLQLLSGCGQDENANVGRDETEPLGRDETEPLGLILAAQAELAAATSASHL
jgi:hypothetical protein